MLRILFSLFLALAACGHTFSEGRVSNPSDSRWSNTSTALLVSSSAILLWDYAQTRGITRDCRESNPIMGNCGQRMTADAYFALVIPVHILGSFIIPKDYRHAYQGAVLGVEANAIIANVKGGYWGF